VTEDPFGRFPVKQFRRDTEKLFGANLHRVDISLDVGKPCWGGQVLPVATIMVRALLG
jgi:hypothetical protein